MFLVKKCVTNGETKLIVLLARWPSFLKRVGRQPMEQVSIQGLTLHRITEHQSAVFVNLALMLSFQKKMLGFVRVLMCVSVFHTRLAQRPR